jgi:hypothetical protein
MTDRDIAYCPRCDLGFCTAHRDDHLPQSTKALPGGLCMPTLAFAEEYERRYDTTIGCAVCMGIWKKA